MHAETRTVRRSPFVRRQSQELDVIGVAQENSLGFTLLSSGGVYAEIVYPRIGSAHPVVVGHQYQTRGQRLYNAEPATEVPAALETYLSALERLAEYVEARWRGARIFN